MIKDQPSNTNINTANQNRAGEDKTYSPDATNAQDGKRNAARSDAANKETEGNLTPEDMSTGGATPGGAISRQEESIEGELLSPEVTDFPPTTATPYAERVTGTSLGAVYESGEGDAAEEGDIPTEEANPSPS